MTTRDIEAAAERYRNRQEQQNNDPQPQLPQPEPDYQSDGSLSFNALLEQNRDLMALVELLKYECGFLHLAVKQRDELIMKLEAQINA